eukprot:CAMPEP_0114567410 /NCGR_PEP_ID=MMETSP0114-20121206/15463_1 /TAXON_ID=31324 /ORGANISM="Goniomonas sp, Strain m" /LENGTH=117 /DNA_ID=CAMNT_0001753991 /DNA_START=99 /DNA_END=452 /DNA_ORIENTATION=-
MVMAFSGRRSMRLLKSPERLPLAPRFEQPARVDKHTAAANQQPVWAAGNRMLWGGESLAAVGSLAGQGRKLVGSAPAAPLADNRHQLLLSLVAARAGMAPGPGNVVAQAVCADPPSP